MRDTFGENVNFDTTEILVSTSYESTLPNLSTTQSVPGLVDHIAAGIRSIVPSFSLEQNTIVSPSVVSNTSTFRELIFMLPNADQQTNQLVSANLQDSMPIFTQKECVSGSKVKLTAKHKVFSCSKCGKNFTASWHRERHMLRSLSCSPGQNFFICSWEGCKITGIHQRKL